jgi:putative GTP pyrophosphokinase
MTKGEIDRLGEKIKFSSKKLKEPLLSELEAYRRQFKTPLSEVFNLVCQKRFKVNREIIVTYRIKRFESIVNKIARYPQMRFSRMWDIGGCRCIVKNDSEVYKLRDQIIKNLILRKENDYIKDPQDDGYRSLHLYVSLPNSEEIIEIQIRNKVDHNWSTLVEISDLIFDAGLKEYKKNKTLLEFHKLLSKKNTINYTEAKRITEIEKSYRYLEKLSEVFSKNYLDVRAQWMEIEYKSAFNYFLIEAKKDEIPQILAFNNFLDAENTYYEKYKVSDNTNIVLTHLPKPSFQQISIAYSNYILSMHNFEDQIQDVLEKVILKSLEEKRFWRFNNFFSYYQNVRLNRIKNSLKELEHSRLILDSKKSAVKNRLRRKFQEWKKDIREEMNDQISLDKKFVLEFMKVYPNSNAITKIIVKNIIKYNSWKFSKEVRIEIRKLKRF